jgi:hypothetical protein
MNWISDKNVKGEILIKGESKKIIVWLTDELFPKCKDWPQMEKLLKEFIKLAGNPEYTHILQNPVEEYKKLTFLIKEYSYKNMPDGVICLNKPFEDFIYAFLDTKAFHYQPSRVCNLLHPRFKTIDYIVTKGEKAESIKEKIRPFKKIWVIDTIVFTCGTLNKVFKDLEIDEKDLTVVTMGITPNAKEELEKKGIKLIYTFEIGSDIECLWHIDDFLNPTPIVISTPSLDEKLKKGEIPPHKLFEILLPYLKGEKLLEEIIREYKIPEHLTNPNLLLRCGKEGYVGQHILGERLVENRDKIKDLLRKAEILIDPSSNGWLKEIGLKK